MNKKLLITGTVFGALSVILGAFAAHGLEKLISTESIETFQTGVRYQMYHALVLLIVGGTSFVNEKTKKIVFYCITFGVVFFSGSIYGLATNELTAFDFKTIGFITPIGGFLFIISWVAMLVELLKSKKE